MLGAADVDEGFFGFFEGENAVDHRPQVVGFERPAHGFEAFAGADQHSLQTDLLHKNRGQAQLDFAGSEHADRGDGAADSYGPQALFEGRTADVDHVVDADTAGQLFGAGSPVRNGDVVDGLPGAHVRDPAQLVEARRGGDHPGAKNAGEL